MAAVLLAWVLAAAAPSTTGPVCALNRLSACQNTNQLAWDDAFNRAVARFLGRRRASYLDRSGLISDQILDVLGGPPDDAQKIGGRFRFTACRAHSCEEKGAAVLEPDGRLVALAILHAGCGARHSANDCFAHQTLNIFVRDPKEQAVIDNLSAWARSEIAQAYTPPGEPPDQLDAVQVTVVK
jgi:hypothetical protein